MYQITLKAKVPSLYGVRAILKDLPTEATLIQYDVSGLPEPEDDGEKESSANLHVTSFNIEG